MSDTKAAVHCIRLFNLDVKVTVWGTIIYCICKALGYLSLPFGLCDTFSLPMIMSLKYSGTFPFFCICKTMSIF